MRNGVTATNSMYEHNGESEQDALYQRIAELEQMVEHLQPYHDLVETMTIPMVLFQPDGRVVNANAAMEHLLDTSRDSVIRTYNILENPEAIASGHTACFRQARNGEVVRMPALPYNPGDGRHIESQYTEPVWTEPIYFPLYDTSGQVRHVASLNLDVTQTRHAEDEIHRLNAELEQRVAEQTASLQQSQALLHGIVEHSPTVMFVKDRQGRYVVLNEHAAQVLGHPRDQVIGKTDAEILPPALAHAFQSDDEQVITSRQAVMHEDVVPTPTGVCTYLTNKFPINDAQGVLIALGGISIDITERKRAEEELQLTQFTLQNLADGIHWLDPDGRQIYVNETLCTMLGYSREELLQISVPDLDPNFPIEAYHAAWEYIRQHGIFISETTHRRKDGTLVPVEVTARFLQFHNKEYVCSSIRDITERKKAEQEREALQQQMIAAQQATISELSTPLLPLAQNIIAMPLVGAIDSQRAQAIMETLLDGIAAHHATIALLDITGVSVMDTQVAQAIIRTAQAVKLLGAQVILTGIQPEIAQTLVHLGADLGGIVTRSTLQSGIRYALHE